ncbi:729_t:CDS:2 [Gigaspora rosea]|nr:729_t:CDS:2 [Gigaspora rosea]
MSMYAFICESITGAGLCASCTWLLEASDELIVFCDIELPSAESTTLGVDAEAAPYLLMLALSCIDPALGLLTTICGN